MSGPMLSKWTARVPQWPCMNQSVPYPFSLSQCQHNTCQKLSGTTMSEQLKWNTLMPWNHWMQKETTDDSWGCLTNDTTHLLLLVLLNNAADMNQCCLCICVFDEELWHQQIHQIIILKQLSNTVTPNLDECNICECLHTLSVLVELYLLLVWKIYV